MDTIVNKVAESGIVTLDLANYLPEDGLVMGFDLKPFLFREMILKEKDFRAEMKEHDWQQYDGKYVAIFCSADAIIPMWAYMLVTSYLEGVAKASYFGSIEEYSKKITADNINTIDTEEYKEKRVVLKGCGDKSVPEVAYVIATEKLKPVVKSLMYGEPCSTVPIYKQPRKKS
ncbi:MAG: DUF2480 family protein [Chitinophagales bacterium]|nr:DUF2480 family protein [Chitinophagaceae bacterium]MCB9064154.1 DUF2480 family protein [Chitinophagales bacterium]